MKTTTTTTFKPKELCSRSVETQRTVCHSVDDDSWMSSKQASRWSPTNRRRDEVVNFLRLAQGRPTLHYPFSQSVRQTDSQSKRDWFRLKSHSGKEETQRGFRYSLVPIDLRWIILCFLFVLIQQQGNKRTPNLIVPTIKLHSSKRIDSFLIVWCTIDWMPSWNGGDAT